jgi:hypothetical protein
MTFALRLLGGCLVALPMSGFITTSGESGADAAPPPAGGYWLAGSDGGVFSFGPPFFGAGNAGPGPGACSFSPQPPSTLNSALGGCVGIASDPDGQGYWLLNAYRSATPYGNAALNQSGCTGSTGPLGPGSAWPPRGTATVSGSSAPTGA